MVHVSAYDYGLHAVERDGPVKHLPPLRPGKGYKAPGLEVYGAWCKAAGFKNRLHIIPANLFVSKRPAAAAAEDEVHCFLGTLFITNLRRTGNKRKKYVENPDHGFLLTP